MSVSVGIVMYPNSLIHFVAQPPGAEAWHVVDWPATPFSTRRW